jgi:hypothetical protein
VDRGLIYRPALAAEPAVAIPEKSQDIVTKPVRLAKVLSFEQRTGIAKYAGHEILHIVSAVTQIAQRDLKGQSRTKDIIKARHIACWLLVRLAGKSSPLAGQILGGRDHTTALNSCRRVDQVLTARDEHLPKSAEAIAEALWGMEWPRAEYGSMRAAKIDIPTCKSCGAPLIGAAQ